MKPVASRSIGELGEFGLIDRLVARLGTGRTDTVVGAGLDDCAVLRLADGRLQLATLDTLVAGVHFELEHTSGRDLGRRLAAINLSDIAAMGGSPTHALATLAAPPDLATDLALDVVDGLVAELGRWGADLVGGNIARHRDLVLDLALLGEVAADRLLLRSGARPDDVVLVTGDLGAAAAGLALRAAPMATDRGPSDAGWTRTAVTEADAAASRAGRVPSAPGVGGAETVVSGEDAALVLARQRTPAPRLDVATLLRPAGATAAIDISDGLAADLGHLCDRSGVGVRIEAGRLPIDEATRRVAAALGADVVQWALSGGEDYELLFTAEPDRAEELARTVLAATGVPVTAIGQCVAGPERVVTMPDGLATPLAGGWEHFGSRTLAR